jgi:predicted amidohydrolase
MNIFALQFDIVWENKLANFATVLRLLAAAQPPPGSLVVLPEMFATGFSMNVGGIAEGEAGETEAFLATLAREFHLTVIGGKVAWGGAGRGRNEAVAYGPEGSLVARYAKLHAFNPAGEGGHYETGQDVALVDCGDWRVAPFVCYDLRFPEIFRVATARGAEVLVVIANWPAERLEHWLALLVARAIENQAYVVGVNRCGRSPKVEYSGRSIIVDPRGRILADAGGGEGVVHATLDRLFIDEYRRNFAVLADRRADFLRAPAGASAPVAQGELNFSAEGVAKGWENWQQERQAAAGKLALQIGLPLGRDSEVWLKDGTRLRGRLCLREEVLFPEMVRPRDLELRIGKATFLYPDIESCVRMD